MTDKSQVIATVGDLLAVGAKAGAARILFNASLIAQREAAEVKHLSQRPAFGRRVKPTEHPHAANDHALPSSDTA